MMYYSRWIVILWGQSVIVNGFLIEFDKKKCLKFPDWKLSDWDRNIECIDHEVFLFFMEFGMPLLKQWLMIKSGKDYNT